jgi:polyisoprenoid-binding protein YceI
MKTFLLIAFALTSAGVAIGADGPCVIPGRGHFSIHTGTAGVFGVFAHDHLIEAQRIEGCATIDSADLAHSSIKLIFPSAQIRVMDSKESATDRAKIQATMETDVLRVAEYPQVLFESTRVERGSAADAVRVHGNLTIRGKTQPIVVPLTLTRIENDTFRARGEFKFKQTSFGIQPVSLAGGTIKVKDELRTEFELFLK